MYAGTDPHVDQVIGRPDGFLVMFDDDDRVADIAQMTQGFEQTRVIALMQADRGLIQHVKNAGQAGANLRRQTDALAFTAGQRARRARQGQIIKPDIVQETETFVDFLQDTRRNLILLVGQPLGNGSEPFIRTANRVLGDVANVFAIDFDGQRFGFEAGTIADFAL